MFSPLYQYYYWRTSIREQRTNADEEETAPTSENGYMECSPLRNNEELYNFDESSDTVNWKTLVKPIKARAPFRSLGNNYGVLSFVKPVRIRDQLIADESRREVLVCHDLMGNYRSDRFVSQKAEDFSDYRFYHWAGVDYFCYFSHNYVTIPPLQWINSAHQNGVKVLGTYIVEFDAGQRILNEVLSSDQNVNKAVEKLVAIARACQFEGWLINIECQVDVQKIPLLKRFLANLTHEVKLKIPQGKVIWYDSVTHTGALAWQNKLNYANCQFFEVSDGIFTNYNWANRDLQETEEIIREKYPDRRRDVFFGLDVFGRGQVAKFDSHLTVARVAERDFSLAIFAPGWTHETLVERRNHSQINQDFIKRNDQFYSSFWKDFFTSGPREMPFYSSFCLGSGPANWQFGRLISNRPWFDLRLQQPVLSVPVHPDFIQYDFSTAFEGGSCLRILGTSESRPLRLFCCSFCCENDLIVSFAVKKSADFVDLELLLNICNGDSYCQIVCGSAQYIRREVDHWPGYYRIQSLNGGHIGTVKQFLAQTLEKHIPCVDELNGWEIRYYYLSFDEQLKWAHCLDIGVRIRGRPIDNEWAQLGAISVHEGIIRRLRSNLPAISESDFVTPATSTTAASAMT